MAPAGAPLVIAATRMELQPLLQRLTGAEGATAGPFAEAQRGLLGGTAVTLAWLGVGKVNTAAGLTLLIERLAPSAVVQVGIAGAYWGSGLAAGEAVVASEEAHLDLGARSPDRFDDLEVLGFPLLPAPTGRGGETGAANRSRPLYNRIPVDLLLSRALAGGKYRLVPFGTSETVSGSPELAAELSGRFGALVESMEGAAAAQVCLACGVPFAETRGISNVAGDRDKRNWQFGAAAAASAGVAAEWLLRGAPLDVE